MTRLLQRVVKVTVIRQEQDSFFRTVGTTIEITGNRIQFEVKKGTGKEPNKTLIKITNLSSQSRADLQRLPLQVMLHAGYDGVLNLVAVGELKRSYSHRVGAADIVTQLQVGDGYRAYTHSRLDKSYRGPVSPLQILKDCAGAMNLKLPPEALNAPELKQTLSSGAAVQGPVRDSLTRILAPYGMSWSTQNGQLVILGDEQVRAGQDFEIDADSGLIESPEETQPDKPKGKSQTKFKTLLDTRIGPGSMVRLNGQLLKQRLKVTDVTHVGDSEPSSDPMATEVQGKAVTK